jgi:N-acetylmuramoyl-L-alanine amidase
MKIYLSPSTQGNNVGAGDYGTESARMNELCDLVENGLIRNYVLYRNSPSMTLQQVVVDSNAKQPQFHIALHSNGFDGTVRGCEIYCHQFGGNGEKLARAIYKYLEPLTPTSDRGVKEGYQYYGKGKPLYELAYTDASAIIIEVGFHDNIDDANWIEEHMLEISDAIIKGINDVAGISNSNVGQVDYKAKYEALLNSIKGVVNNA